MYKLMLAAALTIFSNFCFAAKPIIAPQVTSCIAATLSNTGTSSWKTISIRLTNNCGEIVDMQNTTVTFKDASNLNTQFWGNFNPLSYPINTLQITSQSQPTSGYLSTLSLQFPTYVGANSKLPSGSSITITYGAPKADYVSGSASVILGTPVNTGEIDLTNAVAQPANVAQPYALVRLLFNGEPISDVEVPWKSTVKVTTLAAGTYTVSPFSFVDNNGNTYQGTANPSTLSLSSGEVLTSSVSYAEQQKVTGNIDVNVQALPAVLNGYTSNPSVVLTNTGNSSSSSATTNWNTTTTVSQLTTGATYSFSSPVVTYNGYNCAPTFTPATAIAAATAPTVNLTYACTQITQDTVTLNVNGLPSSVSSVLVTLTPNNATPVTSTVNLTNGQGSSTVQLTDGVTFTVSSSTVNGYNVAYSPQPLTAQAKGVETISYSQPVATGGRIIGYLPGWETPPPASALASAGYTHILVAFGVFSTTNPGQIVPEFQTVSASYIASLHSAGIKVLLSLGGASTDASGTTINFHQALSAASSPSAFVQTFVQSMTSLMTQYGFDGFDFDIESGVTDSGTFTTPTGDIAALASIINTMHAQNPAALLTLVPETEYISATDAFTGDWGSQASLVMQTSSALTWVGIQLYNSGCMLGINGVCYDPTKTASPDFSVAMATDLLANWPTASGFLPYVSTLNPSQVVLGYLIPNASGTGDGTPVIPVATIKRAIECLRTGVKGATSCDTYVPPTTYPGIGGVFGWEVTYDQSNNYAWAKGLSSCVIQGTC